MRDSTFCILLLSLCIVKTWWEWRCYIMCGAVIGRSIFSQILTIDTPQLAHEDKVWRVCCVFEIWFMFYHCHRSTDGNIMIIGPHYNGTWLKSGTMIWYVALKWLKQNIKQECKVTQDTTYFALTDKLRHNYYETFRRLIMSWWQAVFIFFCYCWGQVTHVYVRQHMWNKRQGNL